MENITPLHIATADQRRCACVQPRAAGVSQPWFRKRACSGKTTIVAQGRPAGRPYTNAVAVALPHPRRAYARRSLWTCVCASQKSFFRRQTFALQHKKRGASAPVENITPLQVATAHQRRYACVQPGAAGVSQPWFRKRACSGKTTIVAQGRPAGRPYTNAVAVTLPHPRRANARRS